MLSQTLLQVFQISLVVPLELTGINWKILKELCLMT